MDLEHETDYDRIENDNPITKMIPCDPGNPYRCCGGSGGLQYNEPTESDS